MVKYYNNKMYDTDKAIKLCQRSGGSGSAEFAEELYRKRTGEFFLHGSGGALSNYAQRNTDGTLVQGERIIPISYAQAREWVRAYATDKFDDIFGVSEDDTKIRVSIMLSIRAIDYAKQEAARRKQTISSYLEGLIMDKMGDITYGIATMANLDGSEDILNVVYFYNSDEAAEWLKAPESTPMEKRVVSRDEAIKCAGENAVNNADSYGDYVINNRLL
ncbi:MAG: hypothetical protein LUI05_03015 [Oscillospiraceae bacterium]|nr:hypothetical protein [Oscillospiraceae bacterium]